MMGFYIMPLTVYTTHILQGHQAILTNATISKNSDMFIQWWVMRKLDL